MEEAIVTAIFGGPFDTESPVDQNPVGRESTREDGMAVKGNFAIWDLFVGKVNLVLFAETNRIDAALRDVNQQSAGGVGVADGFEDVCERAAAEHALTDEMMRLSCDERHARRRWKLGRHEGGYCTVTVRSVTGVCWVDGGGGGGGVTVDGIAAET